MESVIIHNALKIPGWMSPDELKLLATIANKSLSIIEVGCFEGRSTRAMADNSDGIIYAIDTWSGELKDSQGYLEEIVDDNTLNKFINNTIGLRASVMVCRGTFEEFHRKLGRADFIFLDADHSYEGTKRDIELALEHIKPGGIIAGHDYRKCWPGVMRAVDELLGSTTLVDTIWISGNL